MSSLRIGLTDPEGPLAREVRNVFHESSVAVSRFVPLGTAGEDGKLSEIDGEAAFLQRPSRETIADLDLLILAGSPADPECRVLAAQGEVPVFDVADSPLATWGCAAILSASHPLPAAASFTVLLPASERGTGGLEELFAQAGDSLNFRPTQAPVFGSRLAFNLFRDANTASLESSIRASLERRFAPCAISMLCARVGVFHGYAASALLQFATEAEARTAIGRLAQSPELSIAEAPGGASTANAVEGSRTIVDPPIPAGPSVSIWFAFDALALTARGALRMASGLLR